MVYEVGYVHGVVVWMYGDALQDRCGVGGCQVRDVRGEMGV